MGAKPWNLLLRGVRFYLTIALPALGILALLVWLYAQHLGATAESAVGFSALICWYAAWSLAGILLAIVLLFGLGYGMLWCISSLAHAYIHRRAR